MMSQVGQTINAFNGSFHNQPTYVIHWDFLWKPKKINGRWKWLCYQPSVWLYWADDYGELEGGEFRYYCSREYAKAFNLIENL